jgi:conjugal transfer pilus assembly protein TraV
MMRYLLPLIFSPLLLVGCATPKYACGVPDGIGCKPLSEVQRMAQNGTLKMRAAPDQLNGKTESSNDEPHSDVEKLASKHTSPDKSAEGHEGRSVQPDKPTITTVSPGTPILIPPRTLRVWVARWPDEDGTLHDETYLYLRLDNGRWLME